MKFLTFLTSFFTANQIFAKGQPTEWQLGFQEAGSPLMQQLIDFHDFVFWIITSIFARIVWVTEPTLFLNLLKLNGDPVSNKSYILSPLRLINTN